MRHEDLPERWKRKLKEYLSANGNTVADRLEASDFPSGNIVRIQFEDDSKVEFNHAFAIEAPELREVGVFTEHCGYHLFPWYESIELTTEVLS